MLILAAVLMLQAPPASGASTGSAAVRGRVVDAETGAPMPRALVVLRQMDVFRQFEVSADGDGVFVFDGLPAAAYVLEAAARRHGASHVAGGTLMLNGSRVNGFRLADGQVQDGFVIQLQGAVVISGRVLDDAGEPLSGIRFRLFRAPSADYGPNVPAVTDDRGAFRIYGIPPGRYFLCADTNRPGMFISATSLLWPRWPASACYPSVVDGTPGKVITALTGEVEGIEIRMPRLRTVRINGTVLDADGAPAATATVWLYTHFRNAGSGEGRRPAADGSFEWTSILPGRYTLAARLGEGPQAQATQSTSIELNLTSDDAEGVVLTMRRPVKVLGRIEYEGGRPANAPILTVSAEPTSVEGRAMRRGDVKVGDDQRFELSGVGERTLRLSGLPTGWVTKYIRYKGQDITDVPTDFEQGDDEIEIVLTTRAAQLSGRVVDEIGNLVERARVLIFPASPGAWKGRPIRESTSSTTQGFVTRPRRAAEYFVLALSERDYADLGSQPPLALIERLAERVTLHEGESRRIDIRLARLPASW